MDTSEFRALTTAQGYTEWVDRTWAPNTVVDTHTHPFDASAILTQGEMWLMVGELTDYLTVGDTFELSANTPHAERYGEQGATYFVARRTPA